MLQRFRLASALVPVLVLLAAPSAAVATGVAGPIVGYIENANDQTGESAAVLDVTAPEQTTPVDVEPDAGQAGPAGEPTPQPWMTLYYDLNGTDPDGNDCAGTGVIDVWSPHELEGAQQVRMQAQDAYDDFVASLGVAALPDCEGVSLDVVLQAAVAQVARTLPRPVIDLAPDSTAITGLRTFLVTGVDMVQSDPNRSVTLQGVTYPVQVELSATHEVEWGDDPGSADVVPGITVPGERYDPDDPDPGPEDITWVYTHTGTFDLSVTTTWRVTVTVAGRTRTADIELPAETEPVTVLEVRSIRDR